MFCNLLEFSALYAILSGNSIIKIHIDTKFRHSVGSNFNLFLARGSETRLLRPKIRYCVNETGEFLKHASLHIKSHYLNKKQITESEILC